MFLSDVDIKKSVANGDIVLKDFDEKRINPASYDILLDNKFKVVKDQGIAFVDPVKGILPEYDEVTVPEDGYFVLHPNNSVLGISRDYFGSTKFMVEVNGKSSLARIGLSVHHIASLINPGHYLNVVLELCNLSRVPILLRPGMRIGQLTFSQITSSVETSYKEKGRYQDKDWQSYVINNNEK